MTKQQIYSFIEDDDSFRVESIDPWEHGYVANVRTIGTIIHNYFTEKNPLDLTLRDYLGIDGILTFVGDPSWAETLSKIEKYLYVNLLTSDFKHFWQSSTISWVDLP